jgi:hypothetical protein
MTELIYCLCRATWTGKNRAHCAVCHITFGGVTSFDAHRRGGKCMRIEKIMLPVEAGGLALTDNGKGVLTSIYGGDE